MRLRLEKKRSARGGWSDEAAVLAWLALTDRFVITDWNNVVVAVE